MPTQERGNDQVVEAKSFLTLRVGMQPGDALRPFKSRTRSVRGGIPTRSVGTINDQQWTCRRKGFSSVCLYGRDRRQHADQNSQRQKTT